MLQVNVEAQLVLSVPTKIVLVSVHFFQTLICEFFCGGGLLQSNLLINPVFSKI